MSTVRDKVLPAIDKACTIIARLGLRRYAVTVRRRAWSSGRVGEGTTTDTDLTITPAPRVREVSAYQIFQSNGTLRTGDFTIDKITPRYTAPTTGGYQPSQIDLQPTSAAEEVLILLAGDEGTFECTVVEKYFDRAFGYRLVVHPKSGPVQG